jgi:hypothetical protein
MIDTLSLDSTIAATKEHISCDLSGEAAILNLNNGIYYGLDPVGASVWKMIQEPVRVGEVRDRLLDQYEVEPERCERDLLELLQNLATNGLIEVKNAAAKETEGPHA